MRTVKLPVSKAFGDGAELRLLQLGRIVFQQRPQLLFEDGRRLYVNQYDHVFDLVFVDDEGVPAAWFSGDGGWGKRLLLAPDHEYELGRHLLAPRWDLIDAGLDVWHCTYSAKEKSVTFVEIAPLLLERDVPLLQMVIAYVVGGSHLHLGEGMSGLSG